jgi:hypothetical protein
LDEEGGDFLEGLFIQMKRQEIGGNGGVDGVRE